jgi:hypothetical protein
MKFTAQCKVFLLSILILIIQFVSLSGFSAILIEQGGKPTQNLIDNTSSEPSKKLSSTKRLPSWDNGNSDSYNDFASLRTHRRVSVSAIGGGNSGIIGTLLELAFTQDNSALILAGLGNGYNSLGFQWKHIIDTDLTVTPYFTTGLVRWQNAGIMRPTNEYRGQIVSKFLNNSNENSKVEFGLDFINATIGMQYTQLSGEYVGLTYFGELSYLVHPITGKNAPVAGFGAGYYF